LAVKELHCPSAGEARTGRLRGDEGWRLRADVEWKMLMDGFLWLSAWEGCFRGFPSHADGRTEADRHDRTARSQRRKQTTRVQARTEARFQVSGGSGRWDVGSGVRDLRSGLRLFLQVSGFNPQPFLRALPQSM
jgi:hypothetical protein